MPVNFSTCKNIQKIEEEFISVNITKYFPFSSYTDIRMFTDCEFISLFTNEQNVEKMNVIEADIVNKDRMEIVTSLKRLRFQINNYLAFNAYVEFIKKTLQII